MKRKCITSPQIIDDTYKNKLLTLRKTKNTKQRSTSTYYLRIIYYVFYRNDSENIPIERIKAQHRVFNKHFMQQHPETEHVPKTGNYNFYNVRGNPNVQFLPLDDKIIEDEYEEDSLTKIIKRISIPSNTPELTSDILDNNPFLSDNNVYGIDNIDENKLHIFIETFSDSDTFTFHL